MDRINELLTSAGTSLEDVRELIPKFVKEYSLTKGHSVFEPPPIYIPDEELKKHGINLDQGWQVKLSSTPDQEGEYSYSFVTPEGKEVLDYVPETPQSVEIPGLEPLDLEGLVDRLYISDEMPVGERIRAEQEQRDLYQAMQSVGRTAETEYLLRQLFNASEDQINDFFIEMEKVQPLPINDDSVNNALSNPQRIPQEESWPVAAARKVFSFVEELYVAREERKEAEQSLVEKYPGIEDRCPELIGKTAGEIKWAADTVDRYFISGWGTVVHGLGGAADWLGNDEWASLLKEYGAKLQAPPPDIQKKGFMRATDPRFWLCDVPEMIPFSLCAVVIAIGSAAAVGATGIGAASSAIIGAIAGGTVTRAFESAIEAGGTYDQALMSGWNEDDAGNAADEVFWKNMSLVGLDASQIAIGLMKSIPGGRGNPFLSIVAKLGVEAITEGGEEIAQDVFDRQARGEKVEFDYRMQEAFMAGGIMGAGFGGALDAYARIRDRAQNGLSGKTLEKFSNYVDEAKAQGLSQEQAEMQAMDRIYETPEGKKAVHDAVDSVILEEKIKEADRYKRNVFFVPSSSDIKEDAFANNFWKRREKELARIPGFKTAIEKLLGPRELTDLGSKITEEVVARNAILWLEIQRQGKNMSGVQGWVLKAISDNPQKLFGFDQKAYSSTMFEKLLPEYNSNEKILADAGTIEHVFTHPEMYNLSERQLRYVTKAHSIFDRILNTLYKEGIAPEGVSTGWYIHRVVVGRWTNGELHLKKGRPGIGSRSLGAEMSQAKERKFISQAEGIKKGIAYSSNPEEYVTTAIEDAYQGIADARFAKEISEFGEKPAEILARDYPWLDKKLKLSKKQFDQVNKLVGAIELTLQGGSPSPAQLRALARIFPEWGSELKRLVGDNAKTETDLREYLGYLKLEIAQQKKQIAGLQQAVTRPAPQAEATAVEVTPENISAGIEAEIIAQQEEAQRSPAVEIPEGKGYGRKTQAFGADASKVYEFVFKVVEAGDLIVSHTDALEINPAYPKELQPRQRERAASQLQIARIASRFNPDAMLVDSKALDTGPVIIGSDNAVESGNGRILALRKVIESSPEKYQAYLDALRERATEYGIEATDIDDIKRPVLVRERVSIVDRADFAREANEASVMGMSSFEQAVEDAKRISPEQLALKENESVEAALRRSTNKDIVSRFISKLPVNERSTIMDKAGNINKAGLSRIKWALFAKTYKGEAGEQLARTFSESIDPTIENVQKALFQTLPQVAVLESKVDAGTLEGEASLSNILSKPIQVYARLKTEGPSVDKYLHQASMFERELSPIQQEILGFIDVVGRSPKQLREFINDAADRLSALPPKEQAAMFTTERVTAEGVIRDVINKSKEGLAAKGAAAARKAAKEAVVEMPDINSLKTAFRAMSFTDRAAYRDVIATAKRDLTGAEGEEANKQLANTSSLLNALDEVEKEGLDYREINEPAAGYGDLFAQQKPLDLAAEKVPEPTVPAPDTTAQIQPEESEVGVSYLAGIGEHGPWELTLDEYKASLPSAKDLCESRTREELQGKIQQIFGTYESLDKMDWGEIPSSVEAQVGDISYTADIEYAAVQKDVEETERLLNAALEAIHSEYVEKLGAPKPKPDLPQMPAETPPIPKAEPGMPEAGLQKDIFGYYTPVHPKGKGKMVTMSMDDYNTLQQRWKEAGQQGTSPDAGVIPPIEGVQEQGAFYFKREVAEPDVPLKDEQKQNTLKGLLSRVKAEKENRKQKYELARANRAAQMEKIRQGGMKTVTLPTGEQGALGYIMQPMFGGKLYHQDFIDAINKFFGYEKGSKVLKFTADTAGILRMTKAAFDASVMAIQGLPAFGLAHSTMVTNPTVGKRLMGGWFKALGYSVGAFLDMGVAARYMAAHQWSIEQRMSHGGTSQAVDYFLALHERTGLGGVGRRVLLGLPPQLFLRAETSFFIGAEIVRDETWEALSPIYGPRGENFELARFLDRETGIIDTQAMNVPQIIRQIEQSVVWFAPRYTRACMAFTANMFRGGMTGAMARKSLGGLVGAGSIYFAAVTFSLALLRGDDEEEAMRKVMRGFGVVTDPITGEVTWDLTAEFMSLQVGNYNFGIGGFWYGMVRLLGDVAACVQSVGDREPIDLLKIIKYGGMNRDNPFLKWWYNRSSPLLGTIKELVSGRTYFDIPIETRWEYAFYVMSSFVPIWVEGGIFPYFTGKTGDYMPNLSTESEEPEGLAKVLTPVMEFFGLRVWPEGEWGVFYDNANKYISQLPAEFFKEYYEGDELRLVLEAQAKGELGWKQLTQRARRDLLKLSPDLADNYDDAREASALRDSDAWKSYTARLNAEREARNATGKSADERFRNGEITAREWDEKWDGAEVLYGKGYEDIKTNPAYREVFDYFERLESEGDKYDWQDDLILAEYESIIFADYYDDVTGTMDWDKKDRRISEFIEKHGIATYERMKWYRQQKKGETGISEIRLRHADDVEKLSREYWDLDDEGKKEYRAKNPEMDAALKFWGYGGDLQSEQAYQYLTDMGREFQLSDEAYSKMELPPPALLEVFYGYNALTDATERKQYRLEHPAFDEWGQEAKGWKPITGQNVIPKDISSLLDDYNKQPVGEDRLIFRHENPELDEWLVENKGYTPVGDRVGEDNIIKSPPPLTSQEEVKENWWERFVQDLLNTANEIGVNLGDIGIEDPNSMTPEQAYLLRDTIQIEKGKVEGAEMREQWIKDWAVPEEEAGEWVNYPMKISLLPDQRAFYMSGKPLEVSPLSYEDIKKGYSPKIRFEEGEITLDPRTMEPRTFAHELAHANYFENMPLELRNIYPYAHYLAQVISPEYRDKLFYGEEETGIEIYPGQVVDKGKLPVEGYAMAYQSYGKSPETMPWYIEPFYGNLMYGVPEENKGALAWLAAWTRYKIESALGNLLQPDLDNREGAQGSDNEYRQQ